MADLFVNWQQYQRLVPILPMAFPQNLQERFTGQQHLRSEL